MLLWQGASWLLARFVSWKRETASDPQPYGRLAFVGLLLLMLLGNTPPLAIELYLRHAPGADFYQVARRGATKELIDISAYIRANSQPTDMVGCNAYFFHRVVHYLTTKPVKQLDLSKPHRYQAMKSSQCRYVVVFSTQDAPWPNWHLPFVNEAEPASWWRLYERQESGKYKHIDPTVYEIAKTNAISTK